MYLFIYSSQEAIRSGMALMMMMVMIMMAGGAYLRMIKD